MAALEAEAQAAAEQAEAEGGKHPGDDKVQRNFTDTECASSPPGGCVQLSGGGGQRSPGDRGGAGHETSDKQQAADDGGDHRQRRCSPQGSIRRCWLLLGKGRTSFMLWAWTRNLAPEHATVCATRAPRSHTQPSVSQGLTRPSGVGSATLCGCVEPIRPDQAGPGIPAVPAGGLEKVNGEWSLLHRPAQTVPLWGQSAQESTGRWVSPTSSGTFAEVASTTLFAKLLGAGRRTGKIQQAIHCR